MRLWSLHPSLLDAKGLVALWRETLLAKACLEGKTKGYNNHPQLQRFKDSVDPVSMISHYLWEIYIESTVRGYIFDKTKVGDLSKSYRKIPVNSEQVKYELEHLRTKLQQRSPKDLDKLEMRVCDLFVVVDGPIEQWEKL
jgi:hypothetical protein